MRGPVWDGRCVGGRQDASLALVVLHKISETAFYKDRETAQSIPDGIIRGPVEKTNVCFRKTRFPYVTRENTTLTEYILIAY